MARNKKRFFKSVSEEFSRLNPKKSTRKKKDKYKVRQITPEDWDDLMDEVYFTQ